VATPLNFVRPEVPPELAALVARMMAKDPAERFQTPVEVARALIRFFKKSGTPHPPTTTSAFFRALAAAGIAPTAVNQPAAGVSALTASAGAFLASIAMNEPESDWASLLVIDETDENRCGAGQRAHRSRATTRWLARKLTDGGRWLARMLTGAT
jgi:hypothetical protein